MMIRWESEDNGKKNPKPTEKSNKISPFKSYQAIVGPHWCIIHFRFNKTSVSCTINEYFMNVLRFARITRLVLADLHFPRRTHFRYSTRYLVLSCPHNTTQHTLYYYYNIYAYTARILWLGFILELFFRNRTAFCFIFNVNACGNSNEMKPKLKLKPKFKQASICIHQLSVCCNAYTRFF